MTQNSEPRDHTGAQGDISGARFVWSKRLTGITVAVVLLLSTVGLYLQLGLPAGRQQPAPPSTTESGHATSQEQISGRAAALADRLKEKPDDVEGWSMLARSYISLERYAEAAEAYRQLVKLLPANAGLLADYADTLAMSNNKSFLGEPQVLIDKALALDPKNVKALALSASASFQEKDYAGAVGQWTKILVLVPPDSDLARSTMSSIGEAQNLVEQSGKAQLAQAPLTSLVAPKVATSQAQAVNGASEVSGTVELDASLRPQVRDTDTVFIFVRAVQGPSLPLAVVRKQVKDLPVSFVLGDQVSVVPYAKISSYSSVIVGARVSRSGNATPDAGDLEGQSEPVRPGSKNILVRINLQRN